MQLQNRNIGTFNQVDVTKDAIDKANKINILDIFQHYNIQINEINKKICCPFRHHNNGNERTPSFYYYKDHNSFYCFGCKSGGGTTDFVALYEDISKYTAAIKIINNFLGSSIIEIDNDNSYELFYSHLKFSSLIRDFRLNHNNEEAHKYAEEISKVFDDFVSKYNLDIEIIEKLINKLNQKLGNFKCQPY